MFSSFCVSLHPPPLPIPHSNAVQVIAFLCNCNFNCYQSRWSSSRPPPPSVSQYLPCTHFHTSHFLPYGSHLQANYYQFVHVDAINSQSWGRSIKRLNETSKKPSQGKPKAAKKESKRHRRHQLRQTSLLRRRFMATTTDQSSCHGADI